MAKSQQRLQARQLRERGKSVKEIARKLRVSPGSVSSWCRDIKLSASQIEILERHTRDPFYGRRLEYTLSQQRKRLKKTQQLLKKGIQEVGSLSRRGLFLIGIALYWAEGFKKDTQVGFASSDPSMVKFFIIWLTDCCGKTVDDLSVRVTANISHKHRIHEIQNYWSTITNIPLDKFQKPFFQKVAWKKIYENPNEYFGVLRVRVRRSTDFLRKIKGWIEGVKAHAR